MYPIIFSLTFIIIIVITFLGTKKPKTSLDFTLGGRTLSPFEISSVIIGTLVGGASTIGTVQLAVKYGLAAWIFTLGSGISCFILGLFFAKALRLSESITIPELIGQHFGNKVRKNISILSSIGMFIHIIAQFLACMAVISTVFNQNKIYSLIIVIIIFSFFVISGGLKSALLVGKIKVIILSIMFIFSIFIIFIKNNGIGNLDYLIENNLLSLFAYGKLVAISDLFFMIIGVLSTQIYLQAIFSAKDVKSARKGAFLAAFIIPIFGLAAVSIGLFLRFNHTELINNSVKALPFFLNHYFPNYLAAIFMSFLLIIIAGTGSGLVLGVTTTIFNDVIKINNIKNLRLIAVGILLLTAVIVIFNFDSFILKWSFLSMGLRGTTIFLPLVLVIFFKNYVHKYNLKKFIYLPLIFYFFYVFVLT
jgi:SSS family solute:Na+ symporter